MDTKQIHETLNELCIMGVVRNIDVRKQIVTINTTRLYQLGYSLIFDCFKPIFVKNNHFNYNMNSVLYLDDEIPFESLTSYVVIEIKKDKFSP